jgi:chloramphenicol 3-O phosphotransferase
MAGTPLGTIVILNGVPRSGKTSIANALRSSCADPWVGLGVDLWMAATPAHFLPGIGLRPGGERPDLELFVVASFRALYAAVAECSRRGINIVVDVGHHDSYSQPLGILRSSARQLKGLPVLFVGVRCPIEVVLARRAASEGYAVNEGRVVPASVQRWQDEVHRPGIYDMEVDTSRQSPAECASAITQCLVGGTYGMALRRLAAERT